MRISTAEMIVFFRQLSTLIHSNTPLNQSCLILLQTQSNPVWHEVIYTLVQAIEAGHGLAYGLKKFPAIFNEFICQTIRSGEQTGTLEKTLSYLVNQLEKSLLIKNQIKHALFYPAIVFFVAIIISLTMLIFIVPRFAEFFQHLPGQLPWFTVFIIRLSSTIRENLLLILICLGGFILFLYYLPYPKKFFHKQMYRIPIIRSFSYRFFNFYFVHHLGITYAAGIPISDALLLLSTSGLHKHQQIFFHRIHQKIESGQPLHAAMQTCPLFTPILKQMIYIGEQSGTLQTMLDASINLYETELNQLISQLNQLLEPLIMIILGVLIGGLIIAMYLPIFKLGMIM